ncbi:hypothetical protein FJ945_19615 [Mesorhizobium sp. B2-4-9]|uniref:hypothetical protein n=1 Tax=Mesorhizobium sp. B2-4-9 TaxID=2589940 RepID=UPI00112EE992|nr:hypothetical protein [Mesorhizobium sp. B2-4-9]TPL20955.1 hypothetical protein FJ945_19615 [Mesorhizobium sp. B2-4-9]
MGLGKLICGGTSAPCTANTTLNHLRSSIDRFTNKAVEYLNGEFSEDAQSFGAFCARVTLENACAALVGRFDPFRMLYLAEFQAQGGFEYGKPSKSGFKWAGDVLADEKPGRDLWNSDHDLARISRALFSAYVDHVYWKPAVEKALDYLADHGANETLKELQNIDPETFAPSTKGKCAALYSKLSKGVHWDFFVSSVVMDEGTLKDAIRDCFVHVGNMGFVSHFVPTAYRSLDPTEALVTYDEFRKAFQ